MQLNNHTSTLNNPIKKRTQHCLKNENKISDFQDSKKANSNFNIITRRTRAKLGDLKSFNYDNLIDDVDINKPKKRKVLGNLSNKNNTFDNTASICHINSKPNNLKIQPKTKENVNNNKNIENKNNIGKDCDKGTFAVKPDDSDEQTCEKYKDLNPKSQNKDSNTCKNISQHRNSKPLSNALKDITKEVLDTQYSSSSSIIFDEEHRNSLTSLKFVGKDDENKENIAPLMNQRQSTSSKEKILSNISELASCSNQIFSRNDIKIPKSDFQFYDKIGYFSEYAEEIFVYLKSVEHINLPKQNYMSLLQTDINERMRAILIDQLAEVHEKFSLFHETLFLTVSVIDRFLSCNQVARSKLQLVGCCAMLVACKYEEIYPPEVKDFVFVSDNSYSNEEVLKMEQNIMRSLNQNLITKSPLLFANRYLHIAQASLKQKRFCQLGLELSLIEYKMIGFMPSLLASCAVYCALHVDSETQSVERASNYEENGESFDIIQTKNLQHHTTYTFSNLLPCLTQLLDVFKHPNPKEHYIRKKYSTSKYESIAFSISDTVRRIEYKLAFHQSSKQRSKFNLLQQRNSC